MSPIFLDGVVIPYSSGYQLRNSSKFKIDLVSPYRVSSKVLTRLESLWAHGQYVAMHVRCTPVLIINYCACIFSSPLDTIYI